MNSSLLSIYRAASSAAKQIEKTSNQLPRAGEILCSDELDTGIAETPYSVVYRQDRVTIKHYRPSAKPAYSSPLLIVYALINRDTMLDLQPDRSVIRNLLDSGVELYMLDWGYPARKDRFQSIDDHVNGYIDSAVDFICSRHNVESLNLMGICMGGTFCSIYAALHPEKVRNLILTVSPTSFDTDQGLLHTWWGSEKFDIDSLIDLYGNMPGDLLNVNFLMLNPARLIIDKYANFLRNMDKKDFVENFVRMEKWIFDSPDVPGETFRQFIKDFYKKNKLIQNRLKIGEKHVDLNRITMPVLNVYAEHDHLVPPGACNQITAAVASKDTTDMCLKTGHIGIYVSSRSQKEFVPTICSWLKQRDGKTDRAPSAKKRKQQRSPGRRHIQRVS